jgi:hypothetical protein
VTVGEPLRFEDPSQLGDYRLLRRLGQGGMGVVYLGENQAGGRVAIKVIHPHLASHEEFHDRFRSEVELARKVARFSTAPILDSDTDANPPYIVTEFIDGPTLSAVVSQQGPLSGSQLHALGVGMASALTAIHGVGIVHRDLKPANVLLSRFGPRVIDFGIARAADAVSGFTRTGQYIGSPSYMAPEQFRGEPIGAAADIFAWGAVMAYAGTGRQPFGKSTEAVLYRVVYGEADMEGLDPQLADLVRRTLSKYPAERPTAQQLLDTLVHDQAGGRTSAGPVPSAPAPVLPAGLAPAPVLPAPVAPAPVAPPAVVSTPPAQRPVLSSPPTPRPGLGTGPPRSAPVAPARSSKRWLVGLLASMFLVCCVGGGSLWGLGYLGHTAGRADSLKALGQYLENVKRGRYSSAYDRLCADARDGVSEAQFIKATTAAPRLTGYKIDTDSSNYDLDSNGFYVEVELHYSDGVRRTETFLVADDPGDVDLYTICPP